MIWAHLCSHPKEKLGSTAETALYQGTRSFPSRCLLDFQARREKNRDRRPATLLSLAQDAAFSIPCAKEKFHHREIRGELIMVHLWT